MAKKEIKNNKNKTSFIKSFKAELKKVIWPTPKQLLNNTIAVLAIVVITAAIVFVLDITFESINKYGIDKIKAMVDSSTVENETTNESDEENLNSESEVVEENNEVIEDTNLNNENETVEE